MLVRGQTPLSEIDFFPKVFRQRLESHWIETEEEFFALAPFPSEVDLEFREKWEDAEDIIIRNSSHERLEYLRKFSSVCEKPLAIVTVGSIRLVLQSLLILTIPKILWRIRGLTARSSKSATPYGKKKIVTILSSEPLTTCTDKDAANSAKRALVSRMSLEKPILRKAAILNSCRFGERAYEWQDWEHGIFTAHLLDAMQEYDRVTDWIDYIQPRVYETASTIGQSQNPFASFEGGDIDFASAVPSKTGTEVNAESLLAEVRKRAEEEAAKIIADAKRQAEAITKAPSPPPSEPKAGDRMVLPIKGVKYPFRWCPAGTFLMGSPPSEEGRYSDETQHQVTLSRGFWMLETPVTQAM